MAALFWCWNSEFSDSEKNQVEFTDNLTFSFGLTHVLGLL
jgi:hypothetical protein